MQLSGVDDMIINIDNLDIDNSFKEVRLVEDFIVLSAFQIKRLEGCGAVGYFVTAAKPDLQKEDSQPRRGGKRSNKILKN